MDIEKQDKILQQKIIKDKDIEIYRNSATTENLKKLFEEEK